MIFSFFNFKNPLYVETRKASVVLHANPFPLLPPFSHFLNSLWGILFNLYIVKFTNIFSVFFWLL